MTLWYRRQDYSDALIRDGLGYTFRVIPYISPGITAAFERKRMKQFLM